MLEHGARADEVHILLRKRVAPQIFNERAQSASFTRSQYDAATSWKGGFRRGFAKHFRKELSNYQARKTKALLVFRLNVRIQELLFHLNGEQSREASFGPQGDNV